MNYRLSYFLVLLSFFNLHASSLKLIFSDDDFKKNIQFSGSLDTLNQFQAQLEQSREYALNCLPLIHQSEPSELLNNIKGQCKSLLKDNHSQYLFLGEMYYRIGWALYLEATHKNIGLDLMEYGIGYLDLENEPDIQFELHRVFRKTEHCTIYHEYSALQRYLELEKTRLLYDYPDDIEVQFYFPIIEDWFKRKKESSNVFQKLFSNFSKMESTCFSPSN